MTICCSHPRRNCILHLPCSLVFVTIQMLDLLKHLKSITLFLFISYVRCLFISFSFLLISQQSGGLPLFIFARYASFYHPYDLSTLWYHYLLRNLWFSGSNRFYWLLAVNLIVSIFIFWFRDLVHLLIFYHFIILPIPVEFGNNPSHLIDVAVKDIVRFFDCELLNGSASFHPFY